MRGLLNFQFRGDDLTSLDWVNAAMGGPIDVEFYNGSGSAWVAGSWHEVDPTVTTKGVPRAAKIAPTAGTNSGLCAGVALANTPDGSYGLIRVWGKYAGAATTASITVGTILTTAALVTAAGRALAMPTQTNAAAFVYPCGIVLSTSATTSNDVWVKSPFFHF